MNIFIKSFLIFFLFYGCSTEDTNKQNSKDNEHYGDLFSVNSLLLDRAGIIMEPVSETEFDAIHATRDNAHIIQEFCKQSKGYQENLWEGLNECSWAIEKYNIDQASGRVARNQDTLSIKFANNTEQRFVHNKTNTGNKVYYRFNNYFENSNCFLIEKHENKTCPESRLLNAETGTYHKVEGILRFSKDEKTFANLSFNSSAGNDKSCSNKIGFYKLTEGNLEKLWHLPTNNWVVKELKFKNDFEFYIRQEILDDGKIIENFAKIAMK